MPGVEVPYCTVMPCGFEGRPEVWAGKFCPAISINTASEIAMKMGLPNRQVSDENKQNSTLGFIGAITSMLKAVCRGNVGGGMKANGLSWVVR